MIIETERLTIRMMNSCDFEALSKVFNDKETMKYYPYVFNEEKILNWINTNIERYKTFGFGLFAVCLKNTGELIGDCGITMQNINGTIKPEIGYHIRKDMQRKGYAKEASCAIIEWINDNSPFNEIYSYMHFENEPSRKCAESLGMSHLYDYININGIKTSVYSKRIK